MTLKKDTIDRCKSKEREAQRELYLYLLPFLKPVASRYLRNNQFVLDVLQESFVNIFMKIETYDVSSGSIRSWATRIVINKSLNYNKRVIGISTEDIDVDELREEIYAADDYEEVSKETLKEILSKMPKGYFEVFNLYVIDGYDHEEIGEILEINSALSRKKLSRAKEWLRKVDFMKKIIVLLFTFTLINGI